MVHVGLSGFSYKPWQGEGRFYPKELKAKDFLRFYSERYDAVEMDGTWYRMPTEAGVTGWKEATPTQFTFCCKVHRDISHMRRLKPEAQESLKFMQGRLKPLADVDKLGPFLVQLPPNMKRNDERLAEFLAASPMEFPYALEFRHESWNAPEVEAILGQYNAAWVAAQTDEAEAQKKRHGRLCLRTAAQERIRPWRARRLGGVLPVSGQADLRVSEARRRGFAMAFRR